MGSSDLDYGLEMLGKAVARDTYGIAATNDGGRALRRRIVRGLLALEKAGLANVVRVEGRVFGAELTAAGIDRGRAIAGRTPAPARIPGDVVDVVLAMPGSGPRK
ncbi:hypothetical protein [Methylobacterium oryzae]|uniref:Uncharacterized protein n=1 Tax=Methylobacterium oryzae TaxID=334852 RepID=A0ABU7TQW4_9HYPH